MTPLSLRHLQLKGTRHSKVVVQHLSLENVTVEGLRPGCIFPEEAASRLWSN